MHSAKELSSGAFNMRLAEREITIPELFAGFDERDRLGVVVRSSGGALGASVLIMATITAFYDIQRARAADFFIYPDYFVVHVGGKHGNHAMLDIWPEHKEVVVDDDPEAVLRAINDRAITRLLVPDGHPGNPTFGRATLAGGRLRSALAYDPGGTVLDADVSATGNAVTEAYVAAVIDQSDQFDAQTKAALRVGRERLVEHGRPTESYRRIELDTARALLART